MRLSSRVPPLEKNPLQGPQARERPHEHRRPYQNFGFRPLEARRRRSSEGRDVYLRDPRVLEPRNVPGGARSRRRLVGLGCHALRAPRRKAALLLLRSQGLQKTLLQNHQYAPLVEEDLYLRSPPFVARPPREGPREAPRLERRFGRPQVSRLLRVPRLRRPGEAPGTAALRRAHAIQGQQERPGRRRRREEKEMPPLERPPR
mmetsp:Transcript_10050/g.32749  ORF Transcript_10050/g.32749 Transcript_10050/m.32749 type:complete len:203 (+) Transcript_10050:680-1288(+)